MPNLKIKLTIQRTAFGGDSIAFHGGKTCFVEGALPGEEVEAEILQDKKDFLRLRTVRVLQSSPHRVVPPCEYYGRCGGCQYQHVSYEEELRLKESQLRDVLRKIAGVDPGFLPIVHAADYGYRHSVTFHVERPDKNKPARLCFIAKDNTTKIPVKSCDLLQPSLQAVFKGPVRMTKDSEKIAFKTDEKGALFSDQQDLFLRVRLSGRSLVVNTKGFFQNNLSVTELLCEKVSAWVQKTGPKVFYDLYAGVGTFSLVCAASVPEIICVEESPFAVSALRMNCEEKKPQKIQIVPGRVERAFPDIWRDEKRENIMIFMDPPRQGLEKKLAEFLSAEGRAAAMVYVSCDIATLARDLKILLAGGHWRLEEIAPFDMFPRTKHLEVAVFLSACRGRIT